MKKIIFLCTFVTTLFFMSCNDDDVAPIQPSDISNITSESLPGSIKLYWDVPSDSNYYYVKVKYYDPRIKKDAVRLASVYADMIMIPDTRAKYGEYAFMLQPFSSTNTPGNTHTIQAVSGKARADTTYVNTKLALTENNVTSNDIQPSREPKYLLDGDPATFFHSRWQNPQFPVPYLEVNLDEPIEGGLKFYYSGRDNGRNYPTEIRIEASVDGSDWDVVETISDGLPNPTGEIAEYTSPTILFGNTKKYNHLRFWITKTEDGRRWFVMSEFSLWEVKLIISDPEAPDEDD